MAKKLRMKKAVETLTHEEASRKNIPTAEYQSVMQKEEQSPVRVAYERRILRFCDRRRFFLGLLTSYFVV